MYRIITTALIAASFLLPSTLSISAKAEESNLTYWLVLTYGNSWKGGGITSIPMATKEQCETAGAKYQSSKERLKHGNYAGFECFEGIR